MEGALMQTTYCDHGHPTIVTLAGQLKDGCDESSAIAARTFAFVRDNIVFGFDLYRRKASETLRLGYGACWNKSLLLAGLLREQQIPALLGTIPMKRSFIAPAIGRWHRLGNNPFNHCIVYAHLHGRWTILDPVLDCRTYNTFYVPAEVTWGIDWDAKSDMSLYRESVIGEPVKCSDIDDAICGTLGNVELPKLIAMACYRYLNRKMWQRAGASPVFSSPAGCAK